MKYVLFTTAFRMETGNSDTFFFVLSKIMPGRQKSGCLRHATLLHVCKESRPGRISVQIVTTISSYQQTADCSSKEETLDHFYVIVNLTHKT